MELVIKLSNSEVNCKSCGEQGRCYHHCVALFIGFKVKIEQESHLLKGGGGEWDQEVRLKN